MARWPPGGPTVRTPPSISSLRPDNHCPKVVRTTSCSRATNQPTEGQNTLRTQQPGEICEILFNGNHPQESPFLAARYVQQTVILANTVGAQSTRVIGYFELFTACTYLITFLSAPFISHYYTTTTFFVIHHFLFIYVTH